MTRREAIDKAVRRAVPGLLTCLRTWHDEGQDGLDELIECAVTTRDVYLIRHTFLNPQVINVFHERDNHHE